ncbi:hypothetical protein GCM10022252_21380 [Streptosporangium oxazolinicum]|uniref:PKD domain-containing protein n=2 Tax=Streptosporangium oxazolinicum TaxID=909287 RepID=A0ABP8APP1_9ACTN
MVASGTANVVKLLIATLAFAGAYLGVEATYGTPARPADAAAQAPTRTVELSSRSMPATAQISAQISARVPATVEQAPAALTAPGTVIVSAADALGPCDRPYQARSLVENDDPRAAVSYGWSLERWSPGSRRWQTYLGTGSGFGGESQIVEWQPRVVNNPGWYRVVLSVSGDAPLRSEKFLVSC